MSLISNLAYELRIIQLVYRLFGARKAAQFTFGALTVLLSGANRSAYRFLGVCRTNVFGQNVTLPHPEPRFIDEVVLKRFYTPGPDFQIRDRMTIIDAGANVGVFTIYAASRTPNGRVFALEPDPETFVYLKENVAANNFRNVILLNLALSDKPGVVFISGGNPGSRTILDMGRGRLHGFSAKATALKELIEQFGLERIDLLKMDIEGGEFLVCVEPSWLAHVVRISMEVHPTLGDSSLIIRTLADNNFEVETSGGYDKDTFVIHAKNRHVFDA